LDSGWADRGEEVKETVCDVVKYLMMACVEVLEGTRLDTAGMKRRTPTLVAGKMNVEELSLAAMFSILST